MRVTSPRLGAPLLTFCALFVNLIRQKVLAAFKEATTKLKRCRERMDKAVAQNRPDVVTEATREVEELTRNADKLHQQLREITEVLGGELDRVEVDLQTDVAADIATFYSVSRSVATEIHGLWEGAAADPAATNA